MGYFSDRAYWEQWFPAEFVVEALPGQFRNWFYALLAVSTMMVERSPFKVLKGHGLVLDDVGKPMHKSDGNAIWFEDAAEHFGVDVMRWLYASTPPERNVLFGPQHCDEVRREFILTWWNVYAFFANLARVDGFDPNEHTASADERSLLDRWILSDLNRLIGVAHEAYSQFDVARLCTESRTFIDALSTWYVRRSRRRFYGSGWPADKRAAYATLYEVLTTFNRIITPIIPFMSEAIYQNLVAGAKSDAPVSVHLTPFPTAEQSAIDASLSAHVAASMRLVSLGRAARKESKLKVRQPLANLLVVPANEAERKAVELFEDHLLEELNVKAVSLRENADDLISMTVEPNMKTIGPKFGRDAAAAREAITKLDGKAVADAIESQGSYPLTVGSTNAVLLRDDVAIRHSFGEGWAGAVDGQSVVLLETRITPELKREGAAREINRNVQNKRKEEGLDIADRARLSLVPNSEEWKQVVFEFKDYLASETLAEEILANDLPTPPASGTVDLFVEGIEGSIKISVGRVEGTVDKGKLLP